MKIQKIVMKLSTIILILSILLAVNLPVFAADNASQSGWLNYQSGGSIFVPKSFSATSLRGNSLSQGYVYEYFNEWQQMTFKTGEYDISGHTGDYSVLINYYDQLMQTLPKAVYNNISENTFSISGYSGDNIYYIQYTVDHGSLYTIEMNYPTANRKVCDMYVESFCYSFSTTGYMLNSIADEKPGPADLDIIRADINYPNYSWMYLDEYRNAVVSHDKAVYCFKDPDNDVWRKDNYFTVNRKSAVTILAESEGYACVIINGTNKCGWINKKYLKINNAAQANYPYVSNEASLRDGEYNCLIDWSLNPMLADYYLSFNIDGATFTYPMDSQIIITVYGWGQDGYHEIEYSCFELDRDRYSNCFDFMPGNSSEATVVIKNGTIVSLSIRYAE